MDFITSSEILNHNMAYTEWALKMIIIVLVQEAYSTVKANHCIQAHNCILGFYNEPGFEWAFPVDALNIVMTMSDLKKDKILLLLGHNFSEKQWT